MQAMHGRKLLIDQHRPAVLHGASRERVSLSREAKAFDRLELPNRGWRVAKLIHRLRILILKFSIHHQKLR